MNNTYGYITGKNYNQEFNEYNFDPAKIQCLKLFEENWQIFRDEYYNLTQDTTVDFTLLQQIMRPKTNTIIAKEVSIDSYIVIGLLFNGLTLIDLIDKYNINWENVSREKVKSVIKLINDKYFPQSIKLIKEINQKFNNQVRTVYYGTYKPGLDIKLHTNNNLHTYRGYLGLKVPKGNIGIKVCGKHYDFIEGKFLVLDHAYPHCPHNFTPESRLALLVDFYKHDKDLETMRRTEEEVVAKRMKDNLYSYGVFGKDDTVSEETFIKYGLQSQLEWESKKGITG